jgi:hypothetical protein
MLKIPTNQMQLNTNMHRKLPLCFCNPATISGAAGGKQDEKLFSNGKKCDPDAPLSSLTLLSLPITGKYLYPSSAFLFTILRPLFLLQGVVLIQEKKNASTHTSRLQPSSTGPTLGPYGLAVMVSLGPV